MPSNRATLGDSSPAYEVFEIVPDDNNPLPAMVRSIRVGSNGDVKLADAKGNVVTVKKCYRGEILSIRAKKVFATDTTAGDLLGFI